MNPGKLIIYNIQFLWGILIDASMENSYQLNAEMGTAACFEYLCLLKKHIISISTIICPTNPHILTAPVRTSLAKRFWAIGYTSRNGNFRAFQPGLVSLFP